MVCCGGQNDWGRMATAKWLGTELLDCSKCDLRGESKDFFALWKVPAWINRNRKEITNGLKQSSGYFLSPLRCFNLLEKFLPLWQRFHPKGTSG